jgi:TatD DNase family protein
VIDSHCHLAGEEFVADLDQVVQRARAAGLQRCLVILAADDDVECDRASVLQAAWPGVRFAAGVHPHQALRFPDPAQAAATVVRRLETIDDVVAIGEIGLDYHYHYDFSPRDVQHAVFRAQLRLARDRRLPVVIHTREAEDDTLRLIDEESGGEIRGVFHCFTGSPASAARLLETGFYLSIPGIVTFPKSLDLRDAVREIPDDRLLIETDSPYLVPVPHRGKRKRNEPAYVVHVHDLLADLRGLAPDTLARQLRANFDTLFHARAADVKPRDSVS